MAIRDLFASKNLREHYWRGAIGIPAYYVAFKVLALPTMYSIFGAIALVSFGIYVLRGCPVCWSVGLFNTSRNQSCPIPVQSKKSC